MTGSCLLNAIGESQELTTAQQCALSTGLDSVCDRLILSLEYDARTGLKGGLDTSLLKAELLLDSDYAACRGSLLWL
jgi:hypothetical protein